MPMLVEWTFRKR